jgi:hypothetical protein
VALSHFMRLSLRKGTYAALSSAAWQEIRVRFGRDDNSVVAGIDATEQYLTLQENSHPDLSGSAVSLAAKEAPSFFKS